MRIIVTGGRGWTDTLSVAAVLGMYDPTEGPKPTLVHGGQGGIVPGPEGSYSQGLDFIAAQEAHRYGWRTWPFPAAWYGPCHVACPPGHRREGRNGRTYCPGAGPRRNRAMAHSGSGLLLAWPGGRGTANMIREAHQAGVPVHRVRPEQHQDAA